MCDEVRPYLDEGVRNAFLREISEAHIAKERNIGVQVLTRSEPKQLIFIPSTNEYEGFEIGL